MRVLEILDFLIEAKTGCYAGGGPKISPGFMDMKRFFIEIQNIMSVYFMVVRLNNIKSDSASFCYYNTLKYIVYQSRCIQVLSIYIIRKCSSNGTSTNKALQFVMAVLGQAFEEAITHPPSS